MNYKGKADLTLHCLYSNPRRMVILPDRDVEIESCDSGTKISVELGESGLTVDEVDVSVSGNIHRFLVDTTINANRQYTLHCSPLAV